MDKILTKPPVNVLGVVDKIHTGIKSYVTSYKPALLVNNRYNGQTTGILTLANFKALIKKSKKKKLS